MFCKTESGNKINLLRNIFGRLEYQSKLDEFSDGEFRYLKDNNLLNGFFVEDEDPKAFWLLDEEGNWPSDEEQEVY